MAGQLMGKRVAALVTTGFEQVELFDPRQALTEAGAVVDVVSPGKDKVRGWDHTKWGEDVPVDRPLDQARPDEYDALLLPGGVMNPDKLDRGQDGVRPGSCRGQARTSPAGVSSAA